MAAQAIGSLYAQLGLDSASFDAGIANARKKLSEFGKVNFSGALKAGFGELDDMLKGAAGQAGALGNVLAGLGITGAAAGAAIAVAFAGARDAMAFGDEIADTANKLRVTTDYLQEMRFVAHQLGGDFQDADEALADFGKTLGLARSGLSAKAVKPFTALGLDPKDFTTVEAGLKAVTAKIAGLSNAAEQAAIADKLGLTPLLPAIREGTVAIDDMREAARKIGYVMDAELIEKAGAANDQYEALTAVLGVKYREAMTKAIPLVMSLTEMMVSGADAASRLADKIGVVTDALKKNYDAAPEWAQGLRSAAIRNNPLAFGFRNLDNMLGRPSLRADAKEASTLSDFLKPKAARDNGDAAAVLRNVLEEQSRLSAATRASEKAERDAAAAARERAAALKEIADAMRAAEDRSADYAASLLEEITTMGMSSDQLKIREMKMQAAAAPTEALAKHIENLIEVYKAQRKVETEGLAVQKQVQDQQNETIRTIQDAIGSGIEWSTTLGDLADRLWTSADRARGLAYDIEDIAHAINDNDWASGFAGLLSVLAKVEVALGKNATQLEKVQALAGIGMGVGSIVGGTAGAGISGAASGALSGAAFAGSKLGTLIAPGLGTIGGALLGGAVGLIGSIFGSSKAKKQAKAQAEAQRKAEEAQRQQQIADTRLALEIDLLRAQGKEQEAVNLERKAELDALAKLDASLVAQKQAIFDAIDASNAKAAADQAAAEAAERAAAIQAKARSIQDRIDALTMTDAELLAKARGREREELVALDPALGEVIDRLFGLEDAATATAAAAKMEAESAEAAVRANDLWSKSVADTADMVAQAAQRQADAMRSLGDSFVNAMESAKDAEKSLRSFADSLLSELGLGGQQASYSATRSALQANAARGEFDQSLAQAFLDASRATQSSAGGYQSDVAWVRSLALNKADDLAGYPARLAMLFRAIQADSMSGLPGFASGGSMVIGGNPGVDQNVLSLNGAPVARVGYGETLSVTPAGGSANDNSLAAEVRALRADFAEMKAAIVQTAVSTSQTARQMMRWDGDGMPAERGY